MSRIIEALSFLLLLLLASLSLSQAQEPSQAVLNAATELLKAAKLGNILVSYSKSFVC